jgi:CDP-glucose 4,6-dehydratase
VPSPSKTLMDFYRGKRVALTGHTGLKGSWLALWLHKMGAQVLGLALPPESELGIFRACHLDRLIDSEMVDIRDFEALHRTLARFEPELVFHLAAQAIVGIGYEDPRSTFETNVLGTVNVLDSVRRLPSVSSGVFVSSDKCYENVEQIWGYREIDRLGGTDPYGASKAAAEVAIHAFDQSFFRTPSSPWIASVRAGNVLGGGDWSRFRLVPDCIRALREKKTIELRNPRATRPWQFVLEPLLGYLETGLRLATEGEKFAGAWNFGPAIDSTATVERGARQVVSCWGSGEVKIVPNIPFPEHTSLQLDCTKAQLLLGWRPTLDFLRTMELTTSWYRRQFDSGDGDMLKFTVDQIEQFEACVGTEFSQLP